VSEMEATDLPNFLGVSELKVVHFVPGDGPNSLVQSIASQPTLNIQILTLYDTDKTLPEFCSRKYLRIVTLGFREKNIPRQFYRFCRFLATEKPNLVYAHSFYPSLISAAAAIFFRKITFVPVRHHNKVHLISENSKAIFLDRLISRVTTHTVAVSNAVKETIVNEGCHPRKVSVIYNGLPKPEVHYPETQFVAHAAPFKLIALGRIDWQKNYEGMLKILSVVRSQGHKVELIVLGGGNDKYLDQLKIIQKDLGLIDAVSWLGRKSDIYSYLRDADMFVHTALDEACPLVLMETMMFGIPVFSSNLGGSGDVLEGLYEGADPRNIQEFSDKLIVALNSLTDLRIHAQQIRSTAIERFSDERMQIEYTKLSLAQLQI
jgi:glycosyltransferase involved in cell wall biosynthesis